VKAIVVGAGFAGLAAADELHRAGVEVIVFEARERVGGRVWSMPFAGGVVERGAEFILPGNDFVRDLTDRLGLSLVRKGTLYGDREPRGGESVTREQVRDGLARIAAAPPPPAPPGDRRTLAEALAAYGLPAGVAAVIQARLEVSCAYPAADLDASVLTEGAGAFGEFDSYTVDGGNDRIARSLVETLEDGVHLMSPVRRVAWSDREVRVRAGSHVAVADVAVIAVPVTVMGAITFDPPLRPEKPKVRYGQAAKLFVALTAPAPPSQTLSVPGRWWCYTQLDAAGQPAPFVTAFAGSPSALERLEVQAGPARWLAELERLRPDLELDGGTALLSTWHNDPWARAAYSAESASRPIDTEAWRHPVGPLVFAGEHTAGPWHGLMEGALRSGILAAQQLMHRASR
jgi:monoamine oxidase